MSKLLLLFMIFVIGSVFLFLPRTLAPYDYFPFSDMQLYFATHVYFIVERLVMIILAFVVVSEASEYRGALWVFFALMCADLLDYVLCYNETWFHLGSVPVSMQVLKVLIFGGVILREWIKQLR